MIKEKRIKGLIDVQICTRNRVSELGLLLQSLRTQTYQNFDVFILDDGSNSDIRTHHFIQCLVNSLKIEGHRVNIIRNESGSGVSKARQRLVVESMENGYGELCGRIDDDVICRPDFFEKLIKVIDAGYDLASGVTTPIMQPKQIRQLNHVTPIIDECILKDGKLVVNMDDCGNGYAEEAILPCDHFRSSAIYKKELHDAGVDYNNTLTKHGFREEQLFSFRAILKGFKLGVHTQADAEHLLTPSGGERFAESNELIQVNELELRKFCKQAFEKYGNFIEDYHKKLGVKSSTIESKINKQNNLGERE